MTRLAGQQGAAAAAAGCGHCSARLPEPRRIHRPETPASLHTPTCLKSNFVFNIYSMHLASFMQPLSLALVPLQGQVEKGACTRMGGGRGGQIGNALAADRSAAHAHPGRTSQNRQSRVWLPVCILSGGAHK